MMIVDAHTHIDVTGEHPIGAFEHLLQMMDEFSVDHAVAFPLSDAPDANERMLELIAGDERFVPVAFIDPHEEHAERHLAHLVEDEGVRGLKLHPFISNFHVDDVTLLHPLLAYCDAQGLNVVIHCTTDDPRVHPYRIETLARLYPHATFQIAHMGAIWAANAAIEVARRCPNVYLDSGIASVNAVRRALEAVPRKVLMGADFPFYTYALEQAKVKDAHRFSSRADDSAVLAGALGGNAARLYGL